MFSTILKGYSKHLKETIRLSVPVIMGQLGQVLIGVIDSMMIGELGKDYLSAATLANSVYFIIIVVGMGITFAISPLVAEAWGKGDDEKAGLYLRQGVWVGIWISLITGGIAFLASWGLFYMDQPVRDAQLAFSYLRILCISTLPMIIFLIYKSFSDGLSRTRPAMYITFIGLLMNVVANWLLIYGKMGLPRLELDGAGYATLIGRFTMMALMIAYVNKARIYQRFNPALRWREFDRKIIRKILEIGLPSGFQFFFEVGAFAGAAIMIGWLGAEYRSAHQIAISLASITFMVSFGLGAGATIRVGEALGREDMINARKAGFTGIGLVFVTSVLFSIIFVLGRHVLPTFYNIEEQIVLDIAARLLIIAALFQVFDGIQAVGIGILRGIQDVRIPTLVTFAAYWVICLPLGYLFGFIFGWGVEGMWYAFLVALAIAAVAHTGRFGLLTSSNISSS